MVCLAVMGTISVSAPEPAKVLVVCPKYTVVNAADCEATFNPDMLTTPVPRIILAESDAKYREPLFAILNCATPDAASAESGEAAEGREVVMTSFTRLS